MKTDSSFFKGTVLLTLSGVAVKLLGAAFRIILTNYVGAAAMSFYSSAYSVYLFLFSLSSAGIPAGISALISRSVAMGRRKDTEKIFNLSAAMFISLGAVLSVVGTACAYPLAVIMNSPEAYPAMLAIMPSVLFISAAAVFKGYFQGFGSMAQTSMSNLIEGAAKTVFGFFGAYYCVSRGYSEAVTVGGAILGVTVSTVLAMIYMLVKYICRNKDFTAPVKSFLREETASVSTLARAIAKTTVPVSATSVTTSLMGAVDAFAVMSRLKSYLSVDTAKTLWGAYGNMTMTLFNLPAFMITSIGVSLIPSVAAAFANRDDHTQKTTENAFTLASVLAFGAAFGLGVLAEPILSLLFPGRPSDVAVAAPLLSLISVSIVSVGLTNVSASTLQATGDAPFTAISAMVGCGIKTVATFLLVSIPSVNIFGAAIATNIAYPVIAAMNLIRLRKKAGIRLNFWGILIKPFLAAAAMGATAFFSFCGLTRFFSNRIAILPCIGISIFVYFVLIQGFKIFDICGFIRKFRKT